MNMPHGLTLKKKLGQHFILNKEVLLKLVKYAEVNSKDAILEVGAGLGNLTELIAEKAGKVIAVEKDPRFTKILKEKFKEKRNVEVIEGDILKINLDQLYFNKVLSNIPYYLSSRFILLMLKQKFDLAVLTLQKEFAERLIAQPGTKKYGRITIAVNRRMRVEILETIPKTMFIPKPKVDSSIVRFKPKKFRLINEEFFEKLVRNLFNQKRRRINKVLLKFLIEKYGEKGKTIFTALNIPEKRVYELSIEELENLTNQITSYINTTVLTQV